MIANEMKFFEFSKEFNQEMTVPGQTMDSYMITAGYYKEIC